LRRRSKSPETTAAITHRRRHHRRAITRGVHVRHLEITTRAPTTRGNNGQDRCLGRHWAVGRQGALRSPEKQREHPRLNPERLLIGASGGVRTDEVAYKPDSQYLHDLSASPSAR
jgi:hypothetical protein